MGESLRVDPAELRAAAGDASAAGEGATPGSAQVHPCASDFVSVTASTRFTGQLDVARTYTTMANAMARQFGVTLQANAAAYESQETASAAMLGGQGVPATTATPAAMAVPAALSATSLSGGQALAAPAGEVPKAPRDIARLIETGRAGTGLRTWEAAETSLRSDARQLDDAAHQLGVAISKLDDSWDSPSAEAARTRMRALQTWYQGHARYVCGLADQAKAHVGNFRRATTDIPTYKQVVDGERELKTAQEANQRSRGMLKPAVVHAQVKLGQLYQASAAGFTSYTVAEAAPEPHLPTPPPAPPPQQPDVAAATGPGNGPVVTPKPQPSPKNAPLEPVSRGPGLGESLTSSGPTWPPAPVDPAAPGQPLGETVSNTAASALPQLVPGIIGGVVGAVGGVLGGLAGAGQKALQNLEQAASPLMSGLGQHPTGGGAPHGGDHSPQSPEPQPPSDLPAPSDVGGGGGGADTEPAGGSQPLSAPTAVAATPAVAVPSSAPMSAPAPEAPAPAVGAMGPMVPPLMGGPRSDGSGPDDKQLYRERKLMVVAPPNSEPVKNRREGRDKARGTDRKAT